MRLSAVSAVWGILQLCMGVLFDLLLLCSSCVSPPWSPQPRYRFHALVVLVSVSSCVSLCTTDFPPVFRWGIQYFYSYNLLSPVVSVLLIGLWQRDVLNHNIEIRSRHIFHSRRLWSVLVLWIVLLCGVWSGLWVLVSVGLFFSILSVWIGERGEGE